LRYSKDGQSHGSIERQDLYTSQWALRNDVEITDTFIDAGYTAKTFDRPDYKKLHEFVSKYHRLVDYLIVDDLDRFSRDTAEALSKTKELQFKYNVQLVSVTDGIIFDYHTPGTLLRTGLKFLLAEENNIDRANKINAGIYTAKAKEGRWIQGGPAPFGYKKVGEGKDRHLEIDETQESIIRFIFDAFLRNAPDYVIKQDVKDKGFPLKGKSVIKAILKNHLYTAQQLVKGCKNLPGGLFPGNWKPIIDMITWQRVQDKLNCKPRTRVAIEDELPLRGLLRCHCGKMLTGAPSKNRIGNYFYYYKCNTSSQHNNISAVKAHAQLHEALGYLSLPDRLVAAIRNKSETLLQEKEKENAILLEQKKREYEAADKRLFSVEEKWINNQMAHETYQRWYTDITQKRIHLKAEIEKLGKDQNQVKTLLNDNLERLTDLQAVYSATTTVNKQELLRQVFDNTLYYKDKIYRTQYIMPVFSHNTLILKQKQLLIVDDICQNSGQVEATGVLSNTFLDFLAFIESLKVA